MDSNEYRTPPEVFEPLRREFGFHLDVAATHANALLEWHFTKEDDALGQPWGDATAFCNPPYSAALVSKFVAKCAEHAKAGGLAVMLLNASTTDTRWFHKYIWDAKMHRPRERVEVRFLPRRICFLDESGVPQKSPRYSNMVVVFHPWEVAA